MFFWLRNGDRENDVNEEGKSRNVFKGKGKSLLSLLYREVNIFYLINLYEIFFTYLLHVS